MANYIENTSGQVFTNIDWSMDGHTLAGKAKVAGQNEGAQDSVLNPEYNGNPITRTMFGVDAINIDWNGAEVGTVNGIDFGIIKTTGELLKERIQHNSPIIAKVA